MGFIEIIEIEYECTIWASEETKIRQVGVTAELDPQACAWQAAQITSHYCCSSAQKSKGISRHPFMSQWKQPTDPIGLLFAQRDDGAWPTFSGRVLA